MVSPNAEQIELGISLQRFIGMLISGFKYLSSGLRRGIWTLWWGSRRGNFKEEKQRACSSDGKMQRSYRDSSLPTSMKEEMWISSFKVVLILWVFYVDFGQWTLAPHCSQWVCNLMGSYPRKSLLHLWLNSSQTHSTMLVDTLSHTHQWYNHTWNKVLRVMSAKKRFGELNPLA